MILRRLDNGQEVEGAATLPFSSERMLLANFTSARELLIGLVKRINPPRWGFSTQLKLVVQPMELLGDGLSQVEAVSFRDLGEQANADKVFISTKSEPLTDPEAMQILESEVQWST